MSLRGPWPPGAGRALGNPIQPSVVYESDGPDALDAQYEGRAAGYTYAREGHPNADVLAGRIDALEGMAGGIVTGSGMAAVTAAVLAVAGAGDHVVGGDQLYGRTLRLMSETLPALGLATSLADATSAEAVAAALRPETRLVLVETVSNPTVRVADLEGIRALCRERGVLLAIDNTFATPRGFSAGGFGADLVIHSVTKLLAGHSDATLGWVAARDAGVAEKMRTLAVTLGLTPSPFDCWLGERGLLSFPLRYDRAEATAGLLADALAETPGVTRVLYPGRADHPDAPRVRALMGARASHMLSFEIAGGRAAANALVAALPEVPFAPTLGDIATTISHPASSSHRGLSPGARAAMGISEGFFRVSVGCDEPEALIGAFRAAVARAVS